MEAIVLGDAFVVSLHVCFDFFSCRVLGQQERDMMTQLQEFMNKYGNNFGNMFSNSDNLNTQGIMESVQALEKVTNKCKQSDKQTFPQAADVLIRDNAMTSYQSCMQKCFADRVGVNLNVMQTQFTTGDFSSFATNSRFNFDSSDSDSSMPHLNVCASQQKLV